MNNKKVLGCDIGNAYGKVALLEQAARDPEKCVPAKLPYGMPTAAFVDKDGGIQAYDFKRRSTMDRNLRTKPQRVVRAVKTRLREKEIRVSDKDGEQTVTPEAVYAAIARDLVTLANLELKAKQKEPVYDLLLTYPVAFAEDDQIKSQLVRSVESVVLDGKQLHVEGLLPEPAAVALDYLYYMQNLAPEDSRISSDSFTALVYDLGHGTLDCATVTASSGREKPYHLIDYVGDPELGGQNFDRLLREVLQQKPELEGADLDKLAADITELKHKLSESTRADLDIFVDGNAVSVSVTREEFEEQAAPLILQSVELVQNLLDRARRKGVSIDYIVLSGGASRMPMVKAYLEQLTEGKIPVGLYRPSDAVSFGAARYAQTLGNILQQFADRNFSVPEDKPDLLEPPLQLMLQKTDKLPCVSAEVPCRAEGPRLSVQVHSTVRETGEKGPTYWFHFDVPSNAQCGIRLKMDENRFLIVECRLPDGSILTQSTLQKHSQSE